MKFYFLIIFNIMLFLNTSFAFPLVDTFSIKGNIKGNYNGYIYLKYYNNYNQYTSDSSLINKGKFYFKGKVNCFQFDACLKLHGNYKIWNDSNDVKFPLDNSNIFIEVEHNNFQKVKVQGIKTIKIFNLLQTRKKTFEIKSMLLSKKLGETFGISEKEKIQDSLNIYNKKILNIDIAYCKNKSNSNLSPYLLYLIRSELRKNQFEEIYSHFSKIQKSSYYGFKILNEINKRDSVESIVGKKAEDFVSLDVNGDTLILRNVYKSNYVLLDFWASWCAPCRSSTPHLKKIYADYHKYGLEIIAIADDIGEEEKWIKAIKDDQTGVWKNILTTTDRKEANGILNSISDRYKILYIPTKILIDKNGYVIGRYSNSEEAQLDNKLKEIFKSL